MNTTNKDSLNEASRGTEETPSSSQEASVEENDTKPKSTSPDLSSCSLTPATSLESDAMKRAAAKKLIERYFYQLIDGCGNPKCGNQHCASSGEIKNLTANQAAAQAIQLFSQEAKLCEVHPSKVARTQEAMEADTIKPANRDLPLRTYSMPGGSGSDSTATTPSATTQDTSLAHSSSSCAVTTSSTTVPQNKSSISEAKILEILETCKETNSHISLIRTIGKVFSDYEALAVSFLKATPCSPIEALLDKAPGDLTNLKKEDFRTLEGDLDKDVDSCARGDRTNPPQFDHPEPQLDFQSVRRAFKALFEIPNQVIETALVTALTTLSESIELDLRLFGARSNINDIIRVFLIIFEIPVLGTSEYLEVALPAICNAVAHLPIHGQGTLAKKWAEHCKEQLRTLLESLQQLVTLKVISGNFSRDFCVQDDNTITAATKVMKIVYYANMLAGQMDSPDLRIEEPNLLPEDPLLDAYNNGKTRKTTNPEDPLALELEVNALDSRKPLLPFEDFYNYKISILCL